MSFGSPPVNSGGHLLFDGIHSLDPNGLILKYYNFRRVYVRGLEWL